MKATWLKLAVTALCLGALFWWAEPASILDRLKGVDIGWIGLALAALILATFSMARRWQIVARALTIEISYRRAVGEYFIAQLANSVLPGGIAGDVARAVRVRHEADLKRAAQSVFAERLLGQIAMLTAMSAGFAAALAIPGGLAWPPLSWLGLAAVAIAAVVGLILSRARGAIGRFSNLLFRLLRKPELLLHGAITTGCLIFAFYACARATGTLIPAAGWLTLIPLVLFAMLLPLTVGGWGWREGAAAALFPLIGASASAGIATGIAYGAVLLLSALPGGLVFVARYGFAFPSSIRRPRIS